MSEQNSYCRLGTRWQLWVQSKTCALCGEPIDDYKDSSIDHIMPKSKGGSDHISNLQITHMRCNSEKGDLHPWLDRLVRFFRRNLRNNRHGKLRNSRKTDKF